MGQLGPRPSPTLWISLFIFNTDCRYEETGLKTQVQLYTGEILRKNLTLKEDNYAPTYLTTSSICTIFYDISFVQKTCQIRRLSSIVVNIFTKFSQTKILLYWQNIGQNILLPGLLKITQYFWIGNYSTLSLSRSHTYYSSSSLFFFSFAPVKRNLVTSGWTSGRPYKWVLIRVTSKKLPNLYISCPKWFHYKN